MAARVSSAPVEGFLYRHGVGAAHLDAGDGGGRHRPRQRTARGENVEDDGQLCRKPPAGLRNFKTFGNRPLLWKINLLRILL